MDIAPLGFAVDQTPLDKAAKAAQDAAKKIEAVADAADAVGKASRESGKAVDDAAKKTEAATKKTVEAKRATDELNASTKKQVEAATATGKAVEAVTRITQTATRAAEDYAKATRGQGQAATATGAVITSLSGTMRATTMAQTQAAAAGVKVTTTFTGMGKAAAGAGESMDGLKDGLEDVAESAGGAHGKFAALLNMIGVGRGVFDVMRNSADQAGVSLGGGSARGLATAANLGRTAFTGLQGAIGTSGIVIAGIGAVAIGAAVGFMKLVDATAEVQDRFAQYEGRLKMALGSQDAATDSMSKLIAMANQVGVSMDTTIDSFARLAQNSESLGATKDEMLQFIETVQKLGASGGISSNDVEGAMVQLGQSLASGKLNGDELRSILERMPPLTKAIADGLGVSVGQLRAMGAAGELTADKVFKAILSQTGKAREEFEHMPDTVEKANARLANSYDLLKAHIGEAINASEIKRGMVNAAAAATAYIDLWLQQNGLVQNSGPKVIDGAAQQAEMLRAQKAKAAAELARIASAADESYNGEANKNRQRQNDIKTYRDELVKAKADYKALEAQAALSAAKEAALLAALAKGRAVIMQGFLANNPVLEARGNMIINDAVTQLYGKGGTKAKPGKGSVYEQAQGDRDALSGMGANITKLEAGMHAAEKEVANANKKKHGAGGHGETPLQGIVRTNDALEKALSMGSGGAVDIYSQGYGAKKSGGEAMVAQEVRKRSLEAQRSVQDMNQAAQSATALAAALGNLDGDQMAMEAHSEALSWKYKTFGNTIADNADIVIQYTDALLKQKRAEQDLADARTMRTMDDEKKVRQAQIDALAVGGGDYDTRRAEAVERAASMRDEGRGKLADAMMADFHDKERLTNAQDRAKSERTIADLRAQALATSTAELRTLELEVRVREARAKVAPLERDGAEKRVRDEDSASRSAKVRATTISLVEQKDALADQYRLARLSGLELKLQTALLERKRALIADGVALTSEEAQQQLQATAQLVLAQDALDKNVERVRALKDAWSEMVGDTEGAILDGFTAAFRDGEDAGKAMFRGLEQAGFAWINKMVDKLAISPLLNILEQFGERAIGSLFGSKAPLPGAPTNLAPTSLPSANGNVFSGGGHIPFANGGVVDRPTTFSMSGGRKGLMGEAGTEGIFPLARGGDGKLGLKVIGGGGGSNVSVQVVDMRTSKGAEPPQVQERRGSNGERQIQVLVRDNVKQGIRNGQFDTDLQSQYGLGRTITER